MRYGEFTMIETDTQRKTNFAVTLTPCNLKENTYIARVPRKTITTDQLLDLVSAHNQGIDRFSVAHAMELLKKEILEQAELGFSVDIMDICKLYIAPTSSVQSLTPEAETVTGFEARFAVNEKLKERLKKVSASVAGVVDSAPKITQIENPIDSKASGVLKATFSARIKGDKLQVGGEGSGVFFVPCLAGGSADENEDHWIKVPDGYFSKNTKTTLEFYLPRTLEADKKYFIAVRTASRGKLELKSAVTGMSKIAVTIEEE